MSWRKTDARRLRIPTRPSLEYISRLPLVTAADPCPLPMGEVIKLVPEYDPLDLPADSPYVFDPEKAQAAIDFMHECCRHVSGRWAGQPFILQLWQQAIVANVYGWVSRNTGLRRYREVAEFIPRKNGKTTKVGAVVCKQTFADGEMGAEVYSAAADREQASLVWKQAAGMVMQEPVLNERASCHKSLKSIEVHATGSFYRALSADAGTKHGFSASTWIMDELHAQKNRELIDVLETSTGARQQPLGWIITTRDYEGPSICNTKMEYAAKVRDGIIRDDEYLPVLYVLDDGTTDWQAERTWRLANPNFGVSINAETMARDCRKAANEGAAAVSTFKRLRLNMRTTQARALFDMTQVEKSQEATTVPSERELQRAECYAGLDLSSVSDLTSFALWWPGLDFGRVWSWCPLETAHKRLETDRVPYLRWVDDPLARLVLTDGNVAHLDLIEEAVLDLCRLYTPVSTAYDRWGATQLVQHLQEAGVEVTAFGQGFASMSAPTKELLRLVGQAACGHEANPVLRWAFSNTVGKTDEAENLKPDKKRSRDKIDPVVALIMALGESMIHRERTKSAYSTRGYRWL